MTTKIKLTQKQKRELLQIKKETRSLLVRDRTQAVLARDQALTIETIAKALSRSEDFVKRSLDKWRHGKLKEVKYGSHNHKLTSRQRRSLIKTIQEKCPRDLKDFRFRTQFWSTDILKEIISKRYRVKYKDIQSYHKLFKEAGFSFHKPKPRDFRQDPEKIKKFKGALKKSSSSTRIRLSW